MIDFYKEVTDMHKHHKRSVKETLEWYNNSFDDDSNGEVFHSKKLGQYLLGKFLKFNYSPTTKSELEYYDKTPVILSLETKNFEEGLCISGINLNYFPYEVKAYFVSMIGKSYFNTIQREMNRKPNDAYYQYGLPLSYQDICGILSSVNVSFSTRNYYISKMKSIGCISYENLSKIPFLEDYHFVRTNPKKIKKNYYKSL